MFFLSFFQARFIAMLLMAGVFSSAAYGFAATNTVQEKGAGSGSAAISGYQTSAISYALNATNPNNIDSVSFSLTATTNAGTPTTVKARLITNGTWFNCTAPVSPSTAWTCSTTGITASAANQLEVVAAQ